MNKYFAFLLSTLLTPCAWAATPPISVVQPVVQNMITNSSQDLTYTLSTSAPTAVNVHCSFSSSNNNVTYSFNGNGCTSPNGVGILNTQSVPIVLTINVPSSVTGNITNTLTLTQTNGRGGVAPAITYNIPVNVLANSDRTITFKNFCTSPVWFGISSSAAPALNTPAIACSVDSDCNVAHPYSNCVGGFCSGGACNNDSQCNNTNAGTCVSGSCTYCASSADCMAGSSCDTTNNQCFWDLPAPADASTNNYELAAYTIGGSPSSDTVTITDNSATNGYALIWSGGFDGRTGCTYDGTTLDCKTGGCNTSGDGDTYGGCAIGEGFGAPVSKAEVTFAAVVPDTYDISIINGVTVPMAMRPTAGSAASPQAYNNPYLCADPGDPLDIVTSTGTVGGSTWSFTAPSVGYRWVDTDNGTSCTADSTCTALNSAYRCGYRTSDITGNSATNVCGTPLGYWTQDEVCALNASFNQTLVNCTIANVGGSGNSIIQLLGCTGGAAVSCFNINSPSTTCCGCVNWQNFDVTVPTNSSVIQPCLYPNSNWGSGTLGSAGGSVLPGLIWLKQAVQSAYTYPFDDKSSTFTCPSNDGQSGVNYTVVFCPENQEEIALKGKWNFLKR